MDISKIVDQFRDSETLSNLSADETQVFVDLLILTILIDGEVTDTELEGLANQWSQLPFAGDTHLEELVGEHGFETRQWLEQNIQDREAIAGFVTERATRLERDEVKTAALRMVAIVSMTDGVDEEETNLANAFGEALGFDAGRIAAIVDEVQLAGSES